MNSSSKGGRCTTRRQFIAGTAGLVAVSMVAPLASAGALGLGGDRTPATWLGRMVDVAGKGTRIKPLPMVRRTAVEATQRLLIRVRGPWPLASGAALGTFNVGLVYRSCPDHPFFFWQSDSSVDLCNQRLHASADAVAGLRVDCPSRSGSCGLTSRINPILNPGRYVLLVDPAGQTVRPDWGKLAWDDDAQRLFSSVPQMALTAMRLDVTAAT